MAKPLSVGSQTFDLGPPMVVDGLFATITYRLEPDGRGTRYPIVMRRLYGAGRLNPADAPSASLELQEIEKGLATLPRDRAVWSLSDLRRRDDSQFPVQHAAGNLREYFVAGDGRPILAVLQEAVHLGRAGRQPVLFAGRKPRPDIRSVLLLSFLGLVWSVAGYFLFPDWVVTNKYHSGAASGPLIWPFGLVIFGGGLFTLIAPRISALDDWFNRRSPRQAVALALGVWGLAIGLYVVLSWRS